MALIIRSAAFANGGEIPAKYTCEAEDISPPLEWAGLPEHTRSLVLIIDDPDAPDPNAPRMTWVHWVLYNIPPEVTGLTGGADLPLGSEQGVNDWGKAMYNGPCPPIGRHRYFHKLYALDTVLSVQSQPTKAEIETALKGHVLAQAELVGTYEKSGS